MFCQKCGAELKEGVLFCRECGSKVEVPQKRFCRECGNEFEPGSKFCERCGADLNTITDINSQTSNISSNTPNQNIQRVEFSSNNNHSYTHENNTTSFSSQNQIINHSTNEANSPYAKQIYSTIKNDALIREQKKRNSALIPGILTAACIFIALGLILSNKNRNSSTNTNSSSSSTNVSTVTSQERPPRDGFDNNTNVKYKFGNYYFYIPSYWQVDTNQNEIFRAYAESNGSIAFLIINYPVDTEDPVSTDYLYDENKAQDEIDSFSSLFSECRDLTCERYSVDNWEGHLLTQNYTADNYTGHCEAFSFPSIEDNRWFMVVLGMSDNTMYDYTDDFRMIINSIKKVDEKEMIIDSPYLSTAQDTDTTANESQPENNNNQVIESTEDPTEATTVEEPYETPFDYAYKRQYATNYYGYYLIDVDTKKVVYYESSCPEYPYYGNYTGDTASQIKINFPDDGYYVTMTFTGGIGSGASVVIQDDTLRQPFDCVSVEDIAKKVEPYLK